MDLKQIEASLYKSPPLKQLREGFAYKYQYVGKDNTSSPYHLNYHPLIPTTMFQQPAGVSGHLPPPPRCLLAEYRHRTQKHQLWTCLLPLLNEPEKLQDHPQLHAPSSHPVPLQETLHHGNRLLQGLVWISQRQRQEGSPKISQQQAVWNSQRRVGLKRLGSLLLWWHSRSVHSWIKLPQNIAQLHHYYWLGDRQLRAFTLTGRTPTSLRILVSGNRKSGLTVHPSEKKRQSPRVLLVASIRFEQSYLWRPRHPCKALPPRGEQSQNCHPQKYRIRFWENWQNHGKSLPFSKAFQVFRQRFWRVHSCLVPKAIKSHGDS